MRINVGMNALLAAPLVLPSSRLTLSPSVTPLKRGGGGGGGERGRSPKTIFTYAV